MVRVELIHIPHLPTSCEAQRIDYPHPMISAYTPINLIQTDRPNNYELHV